MKSKTEKIKAKGKAVKAKLVAKLKGAAKAGAACLLLAALCGCQSTPSRSQTQTIKDCTFYVFVPQGQNATNVTAESESAAGTIGDLFCQAMMIENSGSESLAPQHTISPTTDLSYGVGTGGGSTWGELFSGMKSLFTGGTATGTATGTSAAATATPSAASASAAGNCADGSCTTPK